MRSGTTVHRINSRAASVCSSRAWAVLLLLWVAGTASAEFVILETRYRPAAELLPAVAPFVEPHGTVAAEGFALIVNAPPETVTAVREIIARLDAPARRLRISVRQGRAQQGRQDRISGSVQVGERTDPAPPGQVAGGHDGVAVSAGGGRWRAQGRVLSTTGSAEDDAFQQVTVVEGRPANIHVGVDVPYPVAYGVGGTVVQGTQLRRVTTGFEVVARLRGDQVWLDIAPVREALHDQGRDLIEVQGLSTTVTGALGEWIAGGHISSDNASQRSGILFRAGSSLHDEREIYFRVEEY
ncbi:MAG: hypothetical protein VX663_06465 [Pseudomonadota bacterium]|nr:hypothetical protein [Pseudomonadota bacterium]